MHSVFSAPLSHLLSSSSLDFRNNTFGLLHFLSFFGRKLFSCASHYYYWRFGDASSITQNFSLLVFRNKLLLFIYKELQGLRFQIPHRLLTQFPLINILHYTYALFSILSSNLGCSIVPLIIQILR